MKAKRVDTDLFDYYSYDDYDEFLRDCWGDVVVCGREFDAVDVLKKMDAVAYRLGYQDYLDGQEPIYKYQCGICGVVYDDEDDAEMCCGADKELEMVLIEKE